MNEQLAAVLTERLGEQAGSDPLAALLLSRLTQTPGEPAAEETLSRRLDRAVAANGRLREELASANAMATHVADLLGACPDCWGLDELCRRCLGAGGPGSSEPDVQRLVRWLTPALRRAGLSLTATSPDSTPSTPITTERHHPKEQP